MFTEKENNFLSKDTSPVASKKWFGGILKKLCNVAIAFVREVPIFGDIIANELQSIVDDADWNFKTTTYTPTPAEQNILDSWMDKRFGPWIQKVANELSTALQSSNFSVQLAGMNKAYIQMCSARAYYRTNDRAGLSDDALSSRNGTIDVVFSPIENLVTTTIETFPIQLTKTGVSSGTVLTKLDMMPAMGNYSTFTHNYSCLKWVLPAGATVGNSIFAPSTTSIVPTPNPVIEQLPLPSGAVPTTTIPPAVPGSTAPAGTPVLIPMTPTTGTTTTSTTEKNFLQKNGVPLALGVVALWALFSKKNKN